MPKQHPCSDSIAHRVRRSSREIGLAIVVTLAALAFVCVAAVSGNTSQTAAISGGPTAPIKSN